MVLVLIAPLGMPVHGAEFDSPGVRDAIDTPGAYVDEDQNTREDVPEKPSAATSPSVVDESGTGMSGLISPPSNPDSDELIGPQEVSAPIDLEAEQKDVNTSGIEKTLTDTANVAISTVGAIGNGVVKTVSDVGGKVVTGLDFFGNVYHGNYGDAAASLANGILGGLFTTAGAAIGTVGATPGAGTVVGAVTASAIYTQTIAPKVSAFLNKTSPWATIAASKNKEEELKHLAALRKKLTDDYKISPERLDLAFELYNDGKKNALIDLRNERLNAMKKN